MSLLLALDAYQIILIVLIALLVIAYPVLMFTRNKKENQRMTEQTNSLKRGDKVLTTSGVYGKIIDIKLEGTAKQVTIETGSDKFKSYMTIDAFAIYQVIKDEVAVAKPLQSLQEKPVEESKQDAEQNADDKKPSQPKTSAKKSGKTAEKKSKSNKKDA